MMMGTPSESGQVALERPKEKTKFMEEMTETEAHKHHSLRLILGTPKVVSLPLSLFGTPPKSNQSLMVHSKKIAWWGSAKYIR